MPYESVMVGAGSSTYFGDLANYNHFGKSLTTLPRWNIGLGYACQITPHVSARAMFTWVRLVGDDYTYSQNDPEKYAFQYSRNLHFRNDIKELSFTGLYNFIPGEFRLNLRTKFTSYLFGGIAVIAHNPEARTATTTNGNNSEFAARQWVKLQPLHTEGQGQAETSNAYSLVTVAVPVGFGIRYWLTNTLNVSFELGFRYTFTNYLDDVGGVYAQPGTLEGLSTLLADRRFEYDAARVNTSRYAIAQQLFQSHPELFTTTERGSNDLRKDSYLLSNLSIQYRFPTRIKCPPFISR